MSRKKGQRQNGHKTHPSFSIKRLKGQLTFFRSIIINTSEALVVTDQEGNIKFLNLAARSLLGFSDNGQEKSNILDFANGRKGEIAHLLETALTGAKVDKNLRFSFKVGQEREIPVLLTIDVIKKGKLVLGVLWFIRDISEINRLITTDYLTGLFNRRCFEETLSREIDRMHRLSGQPPSLLFIDIDSFKHGINDKYGHHTGDIVLASVAKVLKGSIREIDILARWGGDEYVVICPETDNESAVALAQRIREIVETGEILISPNGEIKVTISIGVATFVLDGTMEGLVRKANKAMHYAKIRKNRVWNASWSIDKDE